MSLADIVWVGLAGSLGALARFTLDGAIRERFATVLPAGTVFINLTGSFVLGVLTGLVVFHVAPGTLTLVAGTGVCGGYTTFSTASFESVRLAQQGRLGPAAANTAITLFGAIAAAASGLALASL
ncbi:fluoride efflux transporter CrcB [Acidiferrimicrobium sp. IK]|uniref:fluoride efflux transporter CrcB n=1 Tax=Acidiferrimicrobium sp. IK TaxID=2871700 RepID=UPI0021CB1974|nr:fluoride efflux transporter CrcB [Acidiferrimicrobium sp. IK]MCU4186249.1 fluoride efflux transporter CrcB [Acidiferrimicrobium sp. IK]